MTPQNFIKTLLLAIVATLTAVTATAQDNQNSAQGADNLSDSNIEELIITLESDTARQQFISNLQTLLEAREDEPDSRFTLSKLFEIDETSGDLLASYQSLISSLGLTDSAVTKFVLLVTLLFMLLLGVVVNNKLSRAFNRRSNTLRGRLELSANRFSLLFMTQRIIGYALAIFLFFYGLAYLLSAPPEFREIRPLINLIAEYTTLLIVLFLLLVVSWESVNAGMEICVHRSSSARSGRVKTLLPVIRNIIFITTLMLCVMILLSEFGVDIVPLLAGAGVLGIAVGFGAQTMVKDFLTGFTIVLEDLLQVGDVVSVAGRTGLVERITLRKLQLRNLDGTVHTIPHSEVAVVDNKTKDFSYYLMDVGVAYGEDTDRVVACLEQIDEELRRDNEFSASIKEPLEVLGVEQFADSAVVIRVRTKTDPHDKWKVGREFNRRIKQTFDREGIEIPFPHRTIYFGAEESDQKQGFRNGDDSTTDKTENKRHSDSGHENSERTDNDAQQS